MTRKIYFHELGTNAQSHHRAVLPARFCRGGDLDITCSQSLEHFDFDVFVLPRLLATGFLPAVDLLRKRGKKVVWDTDDDLWHLPRDNPASRVYTPEALDVVRWTARRADAVTVSTRPLAEAVEEATGRTPVVLPNLVDLTEWPEPPAREDGPLRILWAGSQHHACDLPALVEPLERLLADCDGIQILFCGDWPDHFAEFLRINYSHLGRMVPHARYAGRVGFVDPVPLADYPRTMAVIRPDIALAPLAGNVFNLSKSNLKWLEYALGGAAVVATDLPPYGDAITDGVDGLLVAPGDAGGWYAAVRRLVEDKDLRRQLADTARRHVVGRHSWQHSPQADAWRAFYRGLA